MLVLVLLIILTDGPGKVWVCCEMATTAQREMQLDEKRYKLKKKNKTERRREKWKKIILVTLHFTIFFCWIHQWDIEQMISNVKSYICTYCTQATTSLWSLYKYQIDSSEIFSRNRGFQINPYLYAFSQDIAKIEFAFLLKMDYIFPAPVQQTKSSLLPGNASHQHANSIEREVWQQHRQQTKIS